MPRSWHRAPGSERKLECADCHAVFRVGGDCSCPPESSPFRKSGRAPLIHPAAEDAGLSADEIRSRFAALIVEADRAAEGLLAAKNPREVGRWQSLVKLVEFRRRLLASAYEGARDREQVNETDRIERLIASMKSPPVSRRRMRQRDVEALLKPPPKTEGN